MAYLDDNQMDKAIKLLERVVAVEQEILADDDPGRRISQNLLLRAYNTLQYNVDYNKGPKDTYFIDCP